jgi:hypothetical protein
LVQVGEAGGVGLGSTNEVCVDPTEIGDAGEKRWLARNLVAAGKQQPTKQSREANEGHWRQKRFRVGWATTRGARGATAFLPGADEPVSEMGRFYSEKGSRFIF